MSATPSWTVHCDGCPAPTPNPDLGHTTAAQARVEAFREGYVNLGATDWCPACQLDGTMRDVLRAKRAAS